MAFQTDNRRIAKNTVLLYFRQILLVLISLYTSRVVLNALGAEDYGIYNVVGGFVSMFSVISGAFSVAISRFMSYVLGEEDEQKLEDLFSTALFIQLCMGILIVILLAVIGVWYVMNVMVLPEERITAALYVLLFSTISFFINLISVPYNALIVAHEHMKAFAYISIFEAIMKLAVVFLVIVLPIDKLISYSFFTVFTAIIVRFSYSIYCNRHFTGCKFHLKFHKYMLKNMLSFVGWAFLGNGAIVLRDQGSTMIINYFCGTVVNASRGIAQNVSSAVQSFVNNFIQAVQPEITKLSASDQLERMRELIFRSCRLCYFLMLIITIPLAKNIEYILHLWLGEDVPAYTNIFVVLTLIDSLIVALNNPLLYGVLAVGKIKVYEILLSLVCLSALPVIYWILHIGFSPAYVYVILVVVRFFIFLSLLWQSKQYGLTWFDFFKQVLLQVIICSVICFFFANGINLIEIENQFFRFISESSIITIFNLIVVVFIGLVKDERRKVLFYIQSKLCLRKKH